MTLSGYIMNAVPVASIRKFGSTCFSAYGRSVRPNDVAVASSSCPSSTYALTRSFRSAMLKRRPITKTKKLRAAPTDNMIANMVQSNDFAVVKRSQRFRMLHATPPSAKGQ